MRRLFGLFAGFLAILVVGTPTSALAQGKTSVLFDGVVLTGKPAFLGKSTGNVDASSLKAKNSVFPGIEVRFNQAGRVTFGVGFQKWELTSGSPEHFSSQLPPEWGYGSGEWSHYDKAYAAKASVIVGTVYINLITKGKVRPFVGVGGGVNFIESESRLTGIWLNPVVPGGGGNQPDQISSWKYNQYLAKGVAGVNIYPVKHLLVSVSGGYVGGPALNFGVGVTF